MSERVFVLEPSQTVQAVIAEELSGPGIQAEFFADGLELLWAACKELPSAVLLNAGAQEPSSLELVRLMRTVPSLSRLPVALYDTGGTPFGQFYAESGGADCFFTFEAGSMLGHVRSLLDAPKDAAAPVLHDDRLMGAVSQALLPLASARSSVRRMCHDCMDLVTEFCPAPALSLLFLDGGEPCEYYMCAANCTTEDEQSFLRICAAEFERVHTDVSLSGLVPQRLKPKAALEPYYTRKVPLSSYLCVPLRDSRKKTFGMLQAVREGNFSAQETELVTFCARHMALALENALFSKNRDVFEKHMRRAFSRFVPEQIIDELVASAGSGQKMAVGEKRDIAILFSDIRSFTNISERNKPETIVAFLNRYFTIMVDIIKRHGGTIDKFIGDAIMALFGAPVSYEDNARRAVAAAHDMRKALASVPLDDLVLPEGMAFNIGIGIHYGDVIVGSIGSKDKTDYSVIGDNVNLASRLEGLTKTYGTMIVVSGTVRDGIAPGQFAFRYLDDVKVKGKAQSVPIYSVDESDGSFPAPYRDAYAKGMNLYKQGIWKLAGEYFSKALAVVPEDKAARLMLNRCAEFAQNPPQDWDGAITFNTK